MDVLSRQLFRIADEIDTTPLLGINGQKRLFRLMKSAEKFNALRHEAIQITGGDSDIYYDNSGTAGSLPEFVGAASIGVEGDSVVLSYEYESSGAGWKKARSVSRTYAGIEEGDFDDWLLKDELKYMTSCVKRAIKYFREYNPDMSEEKAEKIFDGE